MIFHETPLAGLVVVEAEPYADERGTFIRTFDAEEWAAHGLSSDVFQCSISRNPRRWTLRGMHYQAAPHEETKLVRCSHGSIFDVAVDLRPASPTRCRWFGIELTAETPRMLCVPAGFAHGFMTLSDDAEVTYQISEPYRAELARGVRWNDPAFGIEWPADPVLMSERDRSYPDFT